MNIFDEHKTKRNRLTPYGKEQYKELIRLLSIQPKVRRVEDTMFFAYMQEHMSALLQEVMVYVDTFSDTGGKRHYNLIKFKSEQVRDFWAALDCFYSSAYVNEMDVKYKIALDQMLFKELKPCVDSYLNALNLKVNERLSRGIANPIPVLTEVA